MEKPILAAHPSFTDRVVHLGIYNIDPRQVKLTCRDRLKNTRIYGTKIHLDDIQLAKEKKLRCLGHWAFGIPGYPGNIKFDSDQKSKEVILRIPDNVHNIAEYLVKEIEDNSTKWVDKHPNESDSD
jgi:hypothetical protein